jgi:hypothetical protein
MAKKTDLAAAKARKQKIVLVGAGVVLLGLAVIQGPKLLHHGSSTPATAASAPAATDSQATGATAAVAVVTPAPATPNFQPAAYVAGVALPGAPAAAPATGDLVSFTLFADKDPFVQQVGDGTGAAQGSTTDATSGSGTSAPAAAPSATGAVSTPAPKPAPITFATIMLDGKPQQLQLDGKKADKQFPKGAPLFVLVSLKKGEAEIGVAGGSFDNGQTVALKLGKKVTLVDTATGVGYELKLTYTGSEAQVLESFSTAPAQPAGSGASAGASTASTGTTTAAPTTPGS